MTSVLDFGHSLVAALALGGSASAPATVALIDPPALVAACRAHVRPAAIDVARWLESVHRVGRQAGLGPEADRIFVTRTGRAYAPVLEERAHIVARAQDPTFATPVAYFTAVADQSELQLAIGRPPAFADLAIAQRIGVPAAARLLVLTSRLPGAALHEQSPELATLTAGITTAAGQLVTARQATAALGDCFGPGPAAVKTPSVAGWSTRIEPAVPQTRRSRNQPSAPARVSAGVTRK